jgi:BON domain
MLWHVFQETLTKRLAMCGREKNLVVAVLCVIAASCSPKQKDKDIKAMLATTAKTDVTFAGVNYIVSNGVVTLSGACPAKKYKDQVVSTVKETSGVKRVVDHINIAPVQLTGDFALKQSVDSVLMKYPTVEATVQDSTVILQGQTEDKELPKLEQALSSLQVKGIENQLSSR